ncbi:hypothetical protein [Mycobacterium sp.]|uniref:hypothetical protein n=1 Tax=Mycobacterium sp. TaxID=1785 RepID=UPI00260E880C|nr:hypothetical protein [Mycobacterium sp.]
MSTPLPFRQTGQLIDQAGNVIESDVACSIWPAQSSASSGTGVNFTHIGESRLAYFSMLREPNVSLLVDGERYRIVEAVAHALLPHVALRLRRTTPTGS